MTRLIHSLRDILELVDVVVLDQWGVLHNGSTPYPGANEALHMLVEHGKSIAVLSNSGKRAEVNRQRILSIGLDLPADAHVMTSGEIAWQKFASRKHGIGGRSISRIAAISARQRDAVDWSRDNPGTRLVDSLEEADAVLLMAMPEAGHHESANRILDQARCRRLPVYCTNPDLESPRAEGKVISSGVLARNHEAAGGAVVWFGKPFANSFDAVCKLYPDVSRSRILMVGDSMEHDIHGAARAGLSTAFVRQGNHACEFEPGLSDGDTLKVIGDLARSSGGPAPDYSLAVLV